MKQFIVTKSTPVRNGETLCLSLRSLENKTDANMFTVNGKDMSSLLTQSETYVMYVPARIEIKVGDTISLDMDKFVAIDKTAVNEDGETFSFRQLVTVSQHERYLSKQAKSALE